MTKCCKLVFTALSPASVLLYFYLNLPANVADFQVLFYSSEFCVIDIYFPLNTPNFNYWLLHKRTTDFPSNKNLVLSH